MAFPNQLFSLLEIHGLCSSGAGKTESSRVPLQSSIVHPRVPLGCAAQCIHDLFIHILWLNEFITSVLPEIQAMKQICYPREHLEGVQHFWCFRVHSTTGLKNKKSTLNISQSPLDFRPISLFVKYLVWRGMAVSDRLNLCKWASNVFFSVQEIITCFRKKTMNHVPNKS